MTGQKQEQHNKIAKRTDVQEASHQPMYAGVTSFMRLPNSRDLTDVDVAVLGVPYDLATSNRPGARFGPRAIRVATTQLSWTKPWPWAFDPFESLRAIDYGDCTFDSGQPAGIPDEIAQFVRPLITAGVIPLTLGGDHFATYPIIKTLYERHGPLSLIHFDAHSDTWRDTRGRIDHGTMFFHAAQEGLIVPEHSVQLGMRTHNDETHGFNVLDARWLHARSTAEAIIEIRQRVGERPCYLTFDIDFLDPAFAPGTGTPVCGGFSTAQAIELLYGLQGLNWVGADVMEVAPAYDHAEITALAGATLAVNILCLLEAGRRS